jgi:hypothetical protein
MTNPQEKDFSQLETMTAAGDITLCVLAIFRLFGSNFVGVLRLC